MTSWKGSRPLNPLETSSQSRMSLELRALRSRSKVGLLTGQTELIVSSNQAHVRFPCLQAHLLGCWKGELREAGIS